MRMDAAHVTKHLHARIHLIWPLCNRIWPSAIRQKWGVTKYSAVSGRQRRVRLKKPIGSCVKHHF